MWTVYLSFFWIITVSLLYKQKICMHPHEKYLSFLLKCLRENCLGLRELCKYVLSMNLRQSYILKMGTKLLWWVYLCFVLCQMGLKWRRSKKLISRWRIGIMQLFIFYSLWFARFMVSGFVTSFAIIRICI